MKGHPVRVGRTGAASARRVITCYRIRRTAARSYLVVIRRATFFLTLQVGLMRFPLRSERAVMLTVEMIDEGTGHGGSPLTGCAKARGYVDNAWQKTRAVDVAEGSNATERSVRWVRSSLNFRHGVAASRTSKWAGG
jgi:hypothetical protein